MTIYIIGIGLIGGSLAMAFRDNNVGQKIIGYDLSQRNAETAIKLGLVDEIVDLKEGIPLADLVVLATPVSVSPSLAVKILNQIKPHQTLIDVGSIKSEICEMVAMHANRKRFVATHPMWGTEHSGPEAAEAGALKGGSVIICQAESSAEDAVALVKECYSKIGANIIEMGCSEEHDLHAAYISHISHITSFALALTVLEKEREEQHIFDMAASGFESTVRLAKSSYTTWIPIFLRNKYNVLDVLREHIHQLQLMKKAIERDDEKQLVEMIARANTIKKIIG